jgi:phosphate transport system substrate-binding protein
MKRATGILCLASATLIAAVGMPVPQVVKACGGGADSSGPRPLETSLPGASSSIDSTVGLYNVRPDVVGNFAIAGSDTLQPIIVKLATAFKSLQPSVNIAVQGGGSNVAINGFISDQATIRRGDAQMKGHIVSGHVPVLASSRRLTESERTAFRSRRGYDATEIPIALDAVGIYVNARNPIRGLTMQQVDAIFSKDRKRGYPLALTKWGDLGLEQDWGLQNINLYGRDKGSGTRTFFVDEALLGGTMHPTIKEAVGAATEILEIGRDQFGIGFAGIGFQGSSHSPLTKDSRL